MLPVQATIMSGLVLGLADNVPSVLYRAIIAGGQKEGLFLHIDAIATPEPPLQGKRLEKQSMDNHSHHLPPASL